ncbi:hypothetical protein IRJ34_06745 [Paenarthrobacter sp. GOM3]|uniref:hypothetical protein n=1 Tax=Paenarthrobacter sp. GOM3 TaxID=2782567 RepID=UPI001BAC5807|nr:hypothetical protein [Paenarthrobacter sp. GOM3]WOH20016.1 hypothetical protein IRJ34_06745 [Paenarthrobacter sp. GOM3]
MRKTSYNFHVAWVVAPIWNEYRPPPDNVAATASLFDSVMSLVSVKVPQSDVLIWTRDHEAPPRLPPDATPPSAPVTVHSIATRWVSS